MPKLNFFDLTGGINKYSSIMSLNESESKTDWFDAQNVEILQSGGIKKSNGCKNILTSALPAGTTFLGIFDYTRQGKHFPVAVTSQGKLYRFNPDTGELSEKYSGLSSTAKCNFINFNNGVIISNGVDTPIFYEEGYNTVVLDDNPPIGLAMEAYKARVFIASGSGLYYCALGNPNDWSSEEDAGFIENFHDDSSPITALKNYGEYLAIYKKNEVYILSGSAPADFVIKPVADTGTISPFGICNANNNQYYFTGSSIALLNFNSLGQISTNDDASIKIKRVFSELNPVKFPEALCINNYEKNRLMFYFPSSSAESLNICWIYDYLHKCWFKRKTKSVTCGASIDGQIYVCSDDGEILLDDFGENINGNALAGFWVSPWLSFGSPDRLKEINSLNLWVFQDLKHPFTAYYRKNYLEPKTEIIVNTTNVDDLLWDAGFWDTEMFSGTNPVKINIPVLGNFEALQLGFENLNADESFEVIGFSIDYDLA